MTELHVKIDIDPITKDGVIDSTHFQVIRDQFSCVNKSRNMIKNPNKRKFVPKRNYLIDADGSFPIGMVNEIYSYCKSLKPDIKVGTDFVLTPQANYYYEPKFTIPNKYELFKFKKWDYRDIQEKSLHRTFKRGRGVIEVGTAGGKSMVMAGTIKTIANYNPSLNYLIICQPHLVVKTRDEFIEKYEFTEAEIQAWDGDNKPDFGAKVIVGSSRIITDKSLEKVIDRNVVLIDECHIIKRDSLITKQLRKIHTNNIIGYTGTVPLEDYSPEDRWSVLGNIGKVICKVTSDELKDKGYKARSKIFSIKLQGAQYKPNYKEVLDDGTEVDRDRSIVFREEEEYLLRSEKRNAYIKKLIQKFCKGNTLIPVDLNYHEELLSEDFADIGRTVYVINGDTPKPERKRIYDQLEHDVDSILIVKSGVMREGISINNLSYIVGYFSKKSYVRVIQFLGRVERLKKEGDPSPVMFDMYDDTPKSSEHYEQRKVYYDLHKIPVIEKFVDLDH